MIRNDEQFRQYFYLWLLSDCFDNDFNIKILVRALKDYLMKVGYKIIACDSISFQGLDNTNLLFTDLDDLRLYYFEEGKI